MTSSVSAEPTSAPRMPASSGSRLSPEVKKRQLKPRLDHALALQRFEPGDLAVADAAVGFGRRVGHDLPGARRGGIGRLAAADRRSPLTLVCAELGDLDDAAVDSTSRLGNSRRASARRHRRARARQRVELGLHASRGSRPCDVSRQPRRARRVAADAGRVAATLALASAASSSAFRLRRLGRQRLRGARFALLGAQRARSATA